MNGKHRLSAAMPFLVVAAAAIIGAGAVAAVTAHAPTERLVWMVAYLVLVVGAAQATLGTVQAWLSMSLPPPGLRLAEFILFNAGNLGVIGGTLCSYWPLVLTGSLLFAASLAMFLYSSRKSRAGWPVHVYRLLLTILFAGAIVGLVLSAARHLQ